MCICARVCFDFDLNLIPFNFFKVLRTAFNIDTDTTYKKHGETINK